MADIALSSDLQEVASLQRLPTVEELLRIFPTKRACFAYLFEASGAEHQICPGCKKLSNWKQYKERVFSCTRCNYAISPSAGTIFKSSNVDIRLWFVAILLFAHSPRLLPSSFLRHYLGIDAACAFGVRDKIWRHMAHLLDRQQFGAPGVHVEIDETLVNKYVRRRSTTARLSIFGITDRQRFRSFVVADRRRETLFPLIAAHVAPGAIINTDGFASYADLDRQGFRHISVNHSRGFFRGFDGATTVTIDGYWRELKLSLGRTHGGVSETRLQTFCDAHAYNHSNRAGKTGQFWEMLGGLPLPHFFERARERPDACEHEASRHFSQIEGYFDIRPLLQSDENARNLLAKFALRRFTKCPLCNADEKRYLSGSEDRLCCRKCGGKTALRHGTIFAYSKVPLCKWFALIRLLILSNYGTSIAFASSHLNISRQAVISISTRIRTAMSERLAQRQIGGVGQRASISVSRFRVRPKPGRPRLRYRTVIIAVDETGFTCDVLRERSRRYVYLWAKKHIRAGTHLSHAPELIFSELSALDVTTSVTSPSDVSLTVCWGRMIWLKSSLRQFHNNVDFDKLKLYIKEREFRVAARGIPLTEVLDALCFPRCDAARSWC